jgi:DNA-binding transcriptional LysR family regulator
MLDSRKLRHIVAVAEAGSYSRAAELLAISQPALSQSILAVERRYGLQLFDRGRRGAVLTSSGRRIVEDARRLLRDTDTLERNMGLMGRAEMGELRFGLDPLCAGIFLADLLACLGERHVGLNVHAFVQGTGELERLLLAHEIELFVTPPGLLADTSQIEQVPLLTVRVALLARPGHPLANRKGISFDDLARYPFIAGSMPKEADRLGLDDPLWRAATIRCDDYGLMGDVVLRSDAIWLASAALAGRDGETPELVELPPLENQTPMPATEIVIASLKGLSPSPGAQVVRSELIRLSDRLREAFV